MVMLGMNGLSSELPGLFYYWGYKNGKDGYAMELNGYIFIAMDTYLLQWNGYIFIAMEWIHIYCKDGMQWIHIYCCFQIYIQRKLIAHVNATSMVSMVTLEYLPPSSSAIFIDNNF